MSRIAVIGIGYVGLSNAVVLSHNNMVVLFDIDLGKVNAINAGVPPIDDKSYSHYWNEKELRAVSDLNEAVLDADYIIVAVPTDYNDTLHALDTSAVEDTIATVSQINSPAVIIIRSTVPIGFTQRISEKYPDMTIIFMPEFLRQETALYDSFNPSRIVVGTNIPKSDSLVAKMIELFTDCVERIPPVDVVTPSEAEAIKLFSNTYLAMRVAFFNEVDTYAECFGLNTEHIITGICQDSRIMDIYNNPSFGYSGYCLPKDTKQLSQQMSGISGTLVAAIDKSNELRKQYIADQIVALYWEKQNTYKGPVGIYDMKIRDYAKESMLQDLISRIQAAGISVLLFCHAPSSGPEDGEVETDISTFADRCSIIIANRFSPELEPYKNKLYCRDIFNRN